MQISNEAIYQAPFCVNEIESTVENDKVKITSRQQKKNAKVHEQIHYYTRNGLSALIGNLLVQQKILDSKAGVGEEK